MFEYLCDHLIPGCTHRETGDTPEAVRDKAIEHLHAHHGTEYLDGGTSSQLDGLIIPAQTR